MKEIYNHWTIVFKKLGERRAENKPNILNYGW